MTLLEKDFIKIPVYDKTKLCVNCTFNDGITTSCHRPDDFTECWDDVGMDYIFKEKSNEKQI